MVTTGKAYPVVLVGVLTGLALALMLWAEFSLPFFPSYLKYDPSDVPALLAALGMGPGAGVTVEALKNVLFLLTGKGSGGIIGGAANFLAGATFVGVAGLLARGRRGPRVWLACAAGAVVMTAVMSVANFFVFLPLWGIPAGEVAGVVVGAILPFNLFKAALSGVIGALAYARLGPTLASVGQPAAGTAPGRSGA